jgi:hypothetical protein
VHVFMFLMVHVSLFPHEPTRACRENVDRDRLCSIWCMMEFVNFDVCSFVHFTEPSA